MGSIAPDDVEESHWLVYDDGIAVHTVTRCHFLYGRAAQTLPCPPRLVIRRIFNPVVLIDRHRMIGCDVTSNILQAHSSPLCYRQTYRILVSWVE